MSNFETATMEASLYLIPVEIAEGATERTLPAANLAIVKTLREFIVENVRTARRCLRRWDREFPIDECTFFELNEHTRPEEVSAMLQPLREGRSMGVMSEAGCPAVADPGAQAVAIAQREGRRVVPLTGPSSILLALMGSGFNGQGFAFNGYLPVKEAEKAKAVREFEVRALRHGQTQIFIEAPYRNDKLIRFLAETLRPDTLLCVACDITDAERESIVTRPAREWRKVTTAYDKRPAIFLIGG